MTSLSKREMTSDDSTEMWAFYSKIQETQRKYIIECVSKSGPPFKFTERFSYTQNHITLNQARETHREKYPDSVYVGNISERCRIIYHI